MKTKAEQRVGKVVPVRDRVKVVSHDHRFLGSGNRPVTERDFIRVHGPAILES
jgi:hypothetical protein